MSASCANRSTTFPLPSSPHWAPRTTVTLLPGCREALPPLGMVAEPLSDMAPAGEGSPIALETHARNGGGSGAPDSATSGYYFSSYKGCSCCIQLLPPTGLSLIHFILLPGSGAPPPYLLRTKRPALQGMTTKRKNYVSQRAGLPANFTIISE